MENIETIIFFFILGALFPFAWAVIVLAATYVYTKIKDLLH